MFLLLLSPSITWTSQNIVWNIFTLNLMETFNIGENLNVRHYKLYPYVKILSKAITLQLIIGTC